MNNEFDDELGHEDIEKGRSRARKSESTLTGSNGQVRRQQPIPRDSSRCAAQAAKKKKKKRIIIMIIAEIVTLIAIFAYAYVARIMNSFQRPEEYNPDMVRNESLKPEQMEHMEGFWTIAVFGVDSRDGNVNKGTNADVIMVCNIDRGTGEIKLVSIFRDTYLNVSEKNSYNKINSAYATGGAQAAVAALNKNMDLNIEDYVTFNWKAVADGINMLGGVDIDISKAEFAYINSFITETVQKTGVPSKHLKSAGLNHLDGVQAVAYGRLRLMDTDFARTERQRLIIEKAFEKAKKADLGLLNRILLTEVEQIGTNLTFSDFTSLILDIGKYHIGETGGFPYSRGDMIMGKKGDCVIPQTLETNVIELHKFLFNEEDYQPSDIVKKISAKIAVDSGMYKQGKNIDHVATDGGKAPKETTEPETKKSTQETEETSAGETINETDAQGNPLNPTKPGESKPGETKPGESKPGESKPGESKPAETKPGESKPAEIKPGESKPAETKPGGSKPGESKPMETKPEQPTTTPAPGPDTKPSQPTAPHESTAQETKPGPGSGPGSGPGDSGSTGDIPTVPSPPA